VTGPINLGNPNEFTIRELAEKVIAMTGSSSTLDSLPLPQDDPKQRQPDIRRAKDQLGWEPTVQLDEGLERTIDYFRTPHLSGAGRWVRSGRRPLPRHAQGHRQQPAGHGPDQRPDGIGDHVRHLRRAVREGLQPLDRQPEEAGRDHDQPPLPRPDRDERQNERGEAERVQDRAVPAHRALAEARRGQASDQDQDPDAGGQKQGDLGSA
jgi:hypothetical protein